ncbi:T-cell immunoglobulin and mucin domain-containing protein 4 isoform X2 [Mus caroli]|uniref:T-cell immunoglobulin and mucin domain-containing protein 4 isoform X2 n=1 Tax=Mus caroli TaxID=10089 RepID=UPI00111171A8|nr:T-cell immunoglobulin and mucin domain-containing protein 4 isoform X2 [Mus caroli]
MSKGLLLLWLVMELGWLYLTPAASEDTIIGFLGQPVTLPCHYLSWSQSRNSMCWGKGSCPNSKCSAELLRTDGTRIISRKSIKYTLSGKVQFGEVSLTISNTNQGDSGVYCCRIEVPGWFNDVKRNVRLELRKATTTKKPTTTTRPTTTPYVTTTTPELLPTTVMTTSVLPTTTPSQTLATTAFSTAVTTCPSTTPGSFSQETTKGSTITTETLPASNHSQRSMITVSTDIALLRPTALTTSESLQKTTKSHQINSRQTILIIACCVGFVLMVLLFLAFLLRGKVTEANCLQRHKRPDNSEDSDSVLNDMSHGRDDEDGIFTL